MATISQRCKNGRTVSIDVGADETPADAAVRLMRLVAGNGGAAVKKRPSWSRKGSPSSPPPTPSREPAAESPPPTFEELLARQVQERLQCAAAIVELSNIRWLFYGIIDAAKRGEQAKKPILAFGRGGLAHRMLVDPERMPMGPMA